MPTRSLHSSVLRWPDAATVHQAVSVWAVEIARRRREVRRVGYVGSYARGDWGVGSDLDVIIIVDACATPFVDRPSLWETLALPVPVDLRVYTEAEVASLPVASPRMARSLEQEAVWVYARE